MSSLDSDYTIEHCEVYDYDKNVICSHCYLGYKVAQNGIACVEMKCKNEKCKYCEDNPSEDCIICQDGYKVNEERQCVQRKCYNDFMCTIGQHCDEVTQQCQPNTDDGFCQRSSECHNVNSYCSKSESQGICSRCEATDSNGIYQSDCMCGSDKLYCTECAGGICTSCLSGFMLSDGNCIQNRKSIAHCFQYSEGNMLICDICEYGWKPSEDGRSCVTVECNVDNCEYCSINSTEICDKCNYKYELNANKKCVEKECYNDFMCADGQSCNIKTHKCMNSNNDGECIRSSDCQKINQVCQRFSPEDQGHCGSCSVNLSKYPNQQNANACNCGPDKLYCTACVNGICTSCLPGFVLSGSNCVKEEETCFVGHCQHCVKDQLYQCETCKTNFMKNNDGSCTCPEGQHVNEDDECVNDPVCDSTSCPQNEICAVEDHKITCKNYCKDVTCGGKNQMCVNAISAGVCQCREGYEGKDCATCSADFKKIQTKCFDKTQCYVSNPRCSNNRGRCTLFGDNNDQSKCVCIAGYDGEFCDMCADGYQKSGKYCAPVNSCAFQQEQCSNAGKCAVTMKATSCVCKTGYTGSNCEKCKYRYSRNSNNECVSNKNATIAAIGGMIGVAVLAASIFAFGLIKKSRGKQQQQQSNSAMSSVTDDSIEIQETDEKDNQDKVQSI